MQQSAYFDYDRSAGCRSIPNSATTAALNSLGAILNFIGCWLKNFQHNYQ